MGGVALVFLDAVAVGVELALEGAAVAGAVGDEAVEVLSFGVGAGCGDSFGEAFGGGAGGFAEDFEIGEAVFGGLEAEDVPFVANDLLGEVELVLGLGAEGVEDGLLEDGELVDAFAGLDGEFHEGFGGDDGGEGGVLGGDGFAFGGAGAGGEFCVGLVGCDLGWGGFAISFGHIYMDLGMPFVDSFSIGGWGKWGGEREKGQKIWEIIFFQIVIQFSATLCTRATKRSLNYC